MNKQEYLEFANADKSKVQQKTILEFVTLARSDDRVSSIKQVEESLLFEVESDELSGAYSMGRIASSLFESEGDRKERIALQQAPEADIINITEFTKCKRKLSESTIKKLRAFALTQNTGAIRAQCYTIANYKIQEQETIAQHFLNDHGERSHALRQAQIMVWAGCANMTNKVKDYYGTITFEDGSTL